MTERRGRLHRVRHDLLALRLVPNLLTLAAICAGLTAIRFALHDEFPMAVAMIVLAAAIDGIDGRLARLLKSESEIGAELDSLADFLNFGVVPALILYAWIEQEDVGGIWIAVLIYVICCVLRLARFNVHSRDPSKAGSLRFFTGVPAPAGALLALLPLYVDMLLTGYGPVPGPLVSIYLVAIGGLMISRLPTYSFKTLRVSVENAPFILVVCMIPVAGLLTYPWLTLIAMDLLYLAGIAAAWRSARRDSKREEPRDGT